MATIQVPVRPGADAPDVETPDGHELVGGVLVEKAMSHEASRIASRIHGHLFAHCERTGVGESLTADTAYRCFPDRPLHSRKPDVSFVTSDKLARLSSRYGDFPFPPDFVAEVISPNELVYEVNAKLRDFQSVGVPLIWIIDPDNRIATVYTPESISQVTADEELPVGDVLPGFHLRLADVLLPAPATPPEAP